MITWILLILTVAGGILVGFQSSINGLLGSKIGAIEATFVSFIVGTLAVIIAVIFFGRGQLSGIVSVPKWQLIGGSMGAIYVLIMVIVVPKLGVATALMASIAGQVFISIIMDHFGMFGGRHIPIDWQRALGLVLMIGSLILFYKK